MEKKKILKLISNEEDIFLTTNLGEEFESIWNSKNDFKFLDKKFENHAKTHTRGPRPKFVKAQVYELVEHSYASAMLGSFGEDLYLLSLTQHEILDFIRCHKKYLKIPTFFLFKSGFDGDANFHIAQVLAYEDGSIGIDLVGLCFECGFGPSGRRIVVREPSAEDIDVKLHS